MYAIKDSNGRYIDKNSIRYTKETRTWHYISKKDYRYNRDDPIDTGRLLYGSAEEANGVIDYLRNNLHKVKDIGNLEFFIEEIN